MTARYAPVSPAAYAGRSRLRFLRRGRAPLVLDAPGVAIRVTGPFGVTSYRLVHWEMITEVVVWTAADGTALMAVGLRLRSAPAVLRHRLRVGRRYERVPLEAAVTRFAGGRVRVVVRSQQASAVGPVFVWRQNRTPRLPAAVALRIDARGVRFGRGEGSSPPGGRWVLWPEIDAVVRFTIAGDAGAYQAVGVTTPSRAPGGGPSRIVAYRVAVFWKLDDDRLRAAVEAHRPDIPIRSLGIVRRATLPG